MTITNDTSKTASFTVPAEPEKEIHIILEVMDDGDPPMTHWQRTIFNIK